LLKTAKAARWFIASVVALALLGAGLIVAFSRALSSFVTGIFIEGKTVNALLPALVVLVLAGVLRGVLLWAQERLAVTAGSLAKAQLRAKLFESIDRLGYRWVNERSTANLSLLATTSLDALDAYFSRYLPQLVYTALITPALTAIIFFADPLSGIEVILTLPLIPIFMIVIGWATQSVQQRQLDALSRLTSHFVEVLRGLTTLKVFGRAQNQLANIENTSDQYRQRTMKVLRVSFLSGFALELIGSLAVALVAVSIGLRLVNGDLPLSVGLFVLLLAPEAYLPLRMVGANFHASADGVNASKAILDIIDEAEALGIAGMAGGASEAAPVAADQFAPSAITVVHGPSGAGKTTLLQNLRATLPAAEVTWMPQRIGLLPGTVLDNIVGIGAEAYDEARLNAAVELACLDDVSLDALAGNSSATISGGQAQRVGLARAFYRALASGNKFLFLDEPISALDSVRAAKVMDSFKHFAQMGQTVAIISHQPISTADHRLEVARG
jgi:ATP-binding cassette subfamily C protein CydD